MQEQEQNRTEKATPFKLSEAKKKGQVAKSLDVNSLIVVWGLLIALVATGASQWRQLCELCATLFVAAGASYASDGMLAELNHRVVVAGLKFIGPFALAGAAFAVIGNVVQTGLIFSSHPLKPQIDRLNPVAGFKRVFNKRMLFEGLKSVLKLAFFGAIAYFFFADLWPGLPNAGSADVQEQSNWLGSAAVSLLFRLALALLIVGLLDLFFTRWQFAQQMMMSRREMKEEVKRREGDPLIRAKIRELQRENLKQARSMGRVPDADVLITNPNHLAIALRYVRAEMDAPIVIAKGADNWAVDMKALARQHGVPIIERKPLARELFRLSRIDQPIPMESFIEVARVYAELGRKRASDSRYEVRA
ncbi:MAG: EscU/YscU/HrcU family type III secretion system export apparatus switch protein [Steroidobacteraceae bacterium]